MSDTGVCVVCNNEGKEDEVELNEAGLCAECAKTDSTDDGMGAPFMGEEAGEDDM